MQEVLKGNNVEAINFGPRETSLAVSEVIDIVIKIWGDSAFVNYERSVESVYEASKLELDSLLAKELLNWDPIWDQKSAIEATTEWWKGLIFEGKTPGDLCARDIQFALGRTF